jgi:hypothetical protein
MTQPSSTPSLIATIARRLHRETVLDLLQSESSAVRHLVAKWVGKNLRPDEVEQLVLIGLNHEGSVCPGVLSMLQHPDLEVTEQIHRRVLRLLISSNATLRREIVGLIVRRWPEEAWALLSQTDYPLDDESLRTLCLVGDTGLILPLFDVYAFPQRTPPPTIGFLVTPEWLAEIHSDHPAVAEWLIRNCGYYEGPVTAEVLELLSLGFSFVTGAMIPIGPADRWRERVRNLSWRLLPDSDDATYRDNTSLDLHDALDTALFLNAVRETDRTQFAANRTILPSRRQRPQRDPSPVCFHANARYVRRLFLNDARAMAVELSVPDEQMNEFVIHHARVILESDVEQRIVADRRLRAIWLTRLAFGHREQGSRPTAMNDRRSSTSSARSELATKVADPNDEPRRLVIGDYHASPFDEPLSPGAQSICRLAELAGLDAIRLAHWLSDCESRWSRHVVPIGIELQIPQIDPNLFGSWKDALPYLGIPSPNRPEFGGTLEAAFRPMASFHAILLAPPMLHRLGVISNAQAQDIAMHISLQGDLRSDARYLAFPQLFIHPSQRLRNRPDSAMTRVMSKGLVHRNQDIERLSRETEGPNVRTELRMFRVFSDDSQSGTVIAPTYMEDIAATHLLGSAMLSACEQCRSLTAAYGLDIETETASLSPEFATLLHSDLYESTGDPHDEVLLRALPVFRAWSNVRQIVRDKILHADLDQLFRNLRSKHLQVLGTHFVDSHGLDVTTEIGLCSEWIRSQEGAGSEMPIRAAARML